MASRNRVVQLGIRLSKFQQRLQSSRDAVNFYNSLYSNSSGHRLDYRQISQLVKPIGKRVYLIDTPALVKSLEAHGIPSKQAEAITSAMNKVLDGSLENISQNLKAELHKIEVGHEANLSKFKSKIQNSQEHHFTLLQHEAEQLCYGIEKMRGDLSYEIDISITGRLNLNRERGRIRNRLMNQIAVTTSLTKLDQEINELSSHIEAFKYDVIKYCIGPIVSLCAVGIGIIQILAPKQ